MVPPRLEAALLDRLRALLGAEAVSDRGVGDADPRIAAHVSGRSIGRPLAWIRATSTEQVAAVLRETHATRTPVSAVGAATTFWDGLRVEGALVLDALALREPFAIDVEARVAHVGAGWTVREIDQAARAHGLCVAARPDAAGDTPIGSLLAVGSTAGLGMGYGLPIDAISGASAVLGDGRVVRLGAGHLLHGRPHGLHGMPHALGLLTAAEGRGAIVSEVGVLLRRCPYVASARAARTVSGAPRWETLAPILAVARAGLDRGVIDTFRIELGSNGPTGRLELFVRAFSDDSLTAAGTSAERILGELAALGFAPEPVVPEPDDARRGVLPAYESHWSFPVAEHRARLSNGAFWGVEVGVPWGEALRGAATVAAALHDRLAEVGPLHRRFAIYPGHHQVSVGVQTLVPRDAIDRTLVQLHAAERELLVHGVPYRRGELWREQLDARLDADDARDSRALLEALFEVLDPHGLVGPRADR